MNKQQIKKVIKPYKLIDFNYEQIKDIEYAIEKKIPETLLKIIINPKYKKIKTIIDLYPYFNEKEIKKILTFNPSEATLFSILQLRKRDFKIKDFKSIKLILEYSKKENMYTIDDIKHLILFYGVSKEYVEKEFLKNKYKHNREEFVVKAVKNKQVKKELLDILYDMNIEINRKNIYILSRINYLINNNFTKNEIKKVISNYKENYKNNFMADMNIFIRLKKKNEKELLNILYDSNLHISKINYLFDYYFENTINKEQLMLILNYIKKHMNKKDYFPHEEINEIIDFFNIEKDIKKIKNVLNRIKIDEEVIPPSNQMMLEKYNLLYEKYKKRAAELIDEKRLDIKQQLEILKGINNGLTDEDIKKYNKPFFEPEIMSIIRKAIEEKTDEKIINVLISNKELDDDYLDFLKKVLQRYRNYLIKKGYSEDKATDTVVKIYSLILFKQDDIPYYFDEIFYFAVLLTTSLNLSLETEISDFSKILKTIKEHINVNTIGPKTVFSKTEELNKLIANKLISKKEILTVINDKLSNTFIQSIKKFKESIKIYGNYTDKEIEELFLNSYNYFYEKYQNITDFTSNFKDYVDNTIDILKSGIKNGLKEKQIKILFIPSLKKDIRYILIKMYKKYNLNEKQMKLMLLTDFKIKPDIIKNIQLKKDKNKNILLILENKIDKKTFNILKEKIKPKRILEKKNKNISFSKENH